MNVHECMLVMVIKLCTLDAYYKNLNLQVTKALQADGFAIAQRKGTEKCLGQNTKRD